MALSAGKRHSVAQQQGSVPIHYIFAKSHNTRCEQEEKNTEAGGTTSGTQATELLVTFDCLDVSALVNSCLQQTQPQGSKLYKCPAGALIDFSG